MSRHEEWGGWRVCVPNQAAWAQGVFLHPLPPTASQRHSFAVSSPPISLSGSPSFSPSCFFSYCIQCKALMRLPGPSSLGPIPPLNPSSQKLTSPSSWGGDCSSSPLPPAILSPWNGPLSVLHLCKPYQPLGSQLSTSHRVALPSVATQFCS